MEENKETIEYKETSLDVVSRNSKGKEYKNINLKNRIDAGELIKGLEPYTFVVVQKKFVEGRPITTYPLYSCQVVYKGEEVSFVLNEQEHAQYKQIGGIGDNIKISMHPETYIHDNKEKKKAVLEFEKV